MSAADFAVVSAVYFRPLIKIINLGCGKVER